MKHRKKKTEVYKAKEYSELCNSLTYVQQKSEKEKQQKIFLKK